MRRGSNTSQSLTPPDQIDHILRVVSEFGEDFGGLFDKMKVTNSRYTLVALVLISICLVFALLYRRNLFQQA